MVTIGMLYILGLLEIFWLGKCQVDSLVGSYQWIPVSDAECPGTNGF